MSQEQSAAPDWGRQLGPGAHPEAATTPGLAHSCAPASGPFSSVSPEQNLSASLVPSLNAKICSLCFLIPVS